VRMPKRKKTALYAAAILIGLFFLWRIFSLLFINTGKTARDGRPPVTVEADSVLYGPIREVRQLTGSIFPQYQYIVAPKVSGRLIRIQKRIGDSVRTGELIAQIDDAEYQQAVLEAEANLKIAEATLIESRSQFELARQEKERSEQLQAKGIASPAELDAAISNFTALESRVVLSQAQVEQRQASLKSAQIRLGYTRLMASQPGFIGERFRDEGALLAPNEAVASVIGIGSVIVRAEVVEREYTRMRIGQEAGVSVDAFSRRSFTGRVSRIAQMLQETSRMAQVEVEVFNDSLLLKPGMFARIEVITDEKERAQTVPSRAVIHSNGETGVFVIRPGETIAHLIPVIAGIQTQERTEILSPTLPGIVVVLGQHLLEEGSPVFISESPPGQAGFEEKNR
jgi:RND family efflux transporter MFP subunit